MCFRGAILDALSNMRENATSGITTGGASAVRHVLNVADASIAEDSAEALDVLVDPISIIHGPSDAELAETALNAAVELRARDVFQSSKRVSDFGNGGMKPPAWIINELDKGHRFLQSAQADFFGGMPLVVPFTNPPRRVCPTTNRPLRPFILDFVQVGRSGLIIDWNVAAPELQALGLWPLPCPYNRRDSIVQHDIAPETKYVFKAVVTTDPCIMFAKIGVSVCRTCCLSFLHSDQALLQLLPRRFAHSTTLCLDSNGGDNSCLFSESFVQQEMLNHRMRQGASNCSDKFGQLIGHEASRRCMLYLDAGHSHLEWLDLRVSNTVWENLSFNDRLPLVEARGDFVAFHRYGALFESWQSSAHVAMGSPPVDR
jgi:hypothetical protein